MQIDILPFSYKLAGSSFQNFFLKGLPITFSIPKITGSIEAYGYSSISQESLGTYFQFEESSTHFYYECISGEDILGDIEEGLDWETGVVFYLTFFIKTNFFTSEAIIKKLVIKQFPDNGILISSDAQSYIPPQVIMVGTLQNQIEIFPYCKNDSGVKTYAGAQYLDIINDPDALSTGDFLEEEQFNIDLQNTTNLQLSLVDRKTSSKISGYVTYPGAPDFSNYFYFLVFRFKKTTNASVYVDKKIVLFLAKKCGNQGISETIQTLYGYDSDGDEELPPPSPPPTIPPPTIETNGQIIITPGEPVPPYTTKITIIIYDDSETELRREEVTVEDDGKIYVDKTEEDAKIKILYNNPEQESEIMDLETIDPTFLLNIDGYWWYKSSTAQEEISRRIRTENSTPVANLDKVRVHLYKNDFDTHVAYTDIAASTYFYDPVIKSNITRMLPRTIGYSQPTGSFNIENYYKTKEGNSYALIFSTKAPTKGTNRWETPTTYPPSGQIFEEDDEVIYRVEEILKDGSSRWSPKDLTKKEMFYRYFYTSDSNALSPAYTHGGGKSYDLTTPKSFSLAYGTHSPTLRGLFYKTSSGIDSIFSESTVTAYAYRLSGITYNIVASHVCTHAKVGYEDRWYFPLSKTAWGLSSSATVYLAVQEFTINSQVYKLWIWIPGIILSAA